MLPLRIFSCFEGRKLAINYVQHNQSIRPVFASWLSSKNDIRSTNNASNVTVYCKNYSTNYKDGPSVTQNIQSRNFKQIPNLSKPTYNILSHRFAFSTKSPDQAGKSDAKSSAATTEAHIFGEASKLGLFAKFKLMYKKYWYVLIPVHVVTSLGWLGGFYYLSKSGVDIPSLLQHLHISESVIQKLQGSNMGHVAIAYLCYKVATPLRYAVTLGGTTVSIKYLVQMGYIKPIPTKNELMQMYEQKKADRAAAKAERARQDNTEK